MLLYTESPLKFAFSHEFQIEGSTPEPSPGILGVPFDSTTTYLPGARFGPNLIRESSYNLEKYNLPLNKKLEKIFYEMGNIEVVHGNFKKTSQHIESTVEEFIELHIIPVVLGGEHSVSYSVLKALNLENVTVLHFDAHMDLRNTYQGEKFSHATVMRRIYDLNLGEIIQIGIRSAGDNEVEFAKEADIKYYTSSWVKNNLNTMEDLISNINGQIYVTIDMDVLDPAYAPSVGTPCPGGLDPLELQKLIYCLKGKNVVGIDVMEVSSRCVEDITSINAAQVVYDFLCL